MKDLQKILWNNFQPGDVLFWYDDDHKEFAKPDLIMSIVVTETERQITFLELGSLEIRMEISPIELAWTHNYTLRVKC